MGARVEDFFRPSGFMRWTLVPALVAFGSFWFFLPGPWTMASVLFTAVMSSAAFLYAGVLLWPKKFRWGPRVLAAIVGVAYVAYFIDEVFFTKGPIGLGRDTGAATPWNAYLGLTAIGVPSILYAIRGRAGTLPSPDDANVLPSGADLERLKRGVGGDTNAF